MRHNVPGGHIQVATETSRGRAVVSVTNSGQAIPPAEVDRLLQPFQRSRHPPRPPAATATGFGLSIVPRHRRRPLTPPSPRSPVPGGGLVYRRLLPRAGAPAGRPAACRADSRAQRRVMPAATARRPPRSSRPARRRAAPSAHQAAPQVRSRSRRTRTRGQRHPGQLYHRPGRTRTSSAAARPPDGCTRSAGNWRTPPRHRASGFQVTCRGCQPGIGKEPDGTELAAALARVHEGLGGY